MKAREDPSREREIVKWINAVLGEEGKSHNLHHILRDGIVLIRLLNALFPSCAIRKWNRLKEHRGKLHALRAIENITTFLNACSKMGMKESDLFVAQDLYRKRWIFVFLSFFVCLTEFVVGRCMSQVYHAISTLAEKARIHGFKGPLLPPQRGVKRTISTLGENISFFF